MGAQVIDVLEARFEAATNAIKQAPVWSEGSARKEAEYGGAYQELVRAGARPRIRFKYRGPARAKKGKTS